MISANLDKYIGQLSKAFWRRQQANTSDQDVRAYMDMREQVKNLCREFDIELVAEVDVSISPEFRQNVLETARLVFVSEYNRVMSGDEGQAYDIDDILEDAELFQREFEEKYPRAEK